MAITIGLLAGLLAAFWGDLPVLVQLLLALMALDIGTGVAAAVVTRTLSSAVSWRGITRKAVVLLVVLAAARIQEGLGVSAAVQLDDAVSAFYCVHEAISIAENAARAGVPVPTALRRALGLDAAEDRDESRRRG
jgi:toxin secretion/phage lysis holin